MSEARRDAGRFGEYGELSVVAAQLSSMCQAMPACRHLGEQFADLMEDAINDLYIILEDLSLRFCELLESCELSFSSTTDAAVDLAHALLAAPDRCMDILASYLPSMENYRGIRTSAR